MVHSLSAIRIRRFLPALVVTLLLLPAAAGAQATQDTTRLPAAMRSARAAFDAAFRGFDVRAAATLFADSAVVIQGQAFTGKVSIVESWLPQALQQLAAIRFGPSSFIISEDEIVEDGTHYVVPVDAGGAEQVGEHRVTWRKQPDGTWKVMRLEIFIG